MREGNKMKKRIDKIREKVKVEGKVIVSELSQLYGVTEETIRRDLEKLEAEGFLTRTFGGAILNLTPQNDQLHFYKRASTNIEEKKKIGTLVVGVLENEKTIVADASTTVMEAMKQLRTNPSYIILSSSIEIFRELGDSKMKLMSTGGTFNPSSLSLYGTHAKETISRFYPDVALISCKGLAANGLITDSSEEEANTKQVMIQQGKKVCLLVDHTKFGCIGFVKFADLSETDYLITDQKPEEKWIELCQKYGVKVIYP